MSARILLVEDDPALLSILQAAMSYGGFKGDAAESGAAAIKAFEARRYDAVLVDLGLPDLDGTDLLHRLRELSDGPILVVSGRDSERDKIDALDRGADDFIPKPFLPGELLARIRSALRRYRSLQERAQAEEGKIAALDLRDPIELGPMVLDPFDRTVEIEGRKTQLSEAEFKVLTTLATSEGDVVSKTALLRRLYDSDALAETRIVEVYISNIRRKLRSIREHDFILNFRGRGWKLVVPED